LRYSAGLATLIAALTFTTATAAAATTRAVDDDGKAKPNDCAANTPATPTIQAAVTASSAGDTIVVCPGTYQEQVTVPAGKDRLTLISSQRRQAVIKAPATSNTTYTRLRPDLVRIEGAKDVNVVRFTITGPLADDQFCNELLMSNVRILGGGSANLVDNRITQAKATTPALRGCQNGFGVQIGRNAEGDSATGRLLGNEIDDYQKGGVYVDGPGSNLVAAGNVVRGPDLSASPLGLAIAAPNGVQISRGANASFGGNLVADNVFPGVRAIAGGPFIDGLEPGQASGIIVFNDTGADGSAGHVQLQDNAVRHNDTNIGLYNRDGASIEDNQADDATFYDGIFLDVDSEGNRIRKNSARRNAEHDCHDDSIGSGTSGTANFWSDNNGVTETPEGICRKDRGHGHGDGDDDHHGHHGHGRR
jgi:hypothetical protein